MLAPTYSSACAVHSAMEGLTSVFGMRTGGPPPLKHQHSILNLIFELNTVKWPEGQRERERSLPFRSDLVAPCIKLGNARLGDSR